MERDLQKMEKEKIWRNANNAHSKYIKVAGPIGNRKA
jgi:hypothetical protein